MMEAVPDPLSFRGTLLVMQFHWYWMLVALGLGCWVGWRMAGEPAPPVQVQREEDQTP